MKILAFVALLISTAALADSSTGYAVGSKWLKQKLDGNKTVKFPGKTPSGKPCALYLTDEDLGYFYVVVGFDGNVKTKNMNNYIGIPLTPQGDKVRVEFGKTFLEFQSSGSWG